MWPGRVVPWGRDLGVGVLLLVRALYHGIMGSVLSDTRQMLDVGGRGAYRGGRRGMVAPEQRP